MGIYNLILRSNDMVSKLKAIMISGRTLAQGASCEDKMTSEYFNAASICSLSEPDYKALEQAEGKNVLIKSKFGEVVLSSRMDSGLPQGIIFIPYGPWANVVIGTDTGGCGTPLFKGIDVEVERTDSNVKDIRLLFKDLEWIR
jgi:formylmethanofuran dehydrogenase subunit D